MSKDDLSRWVITIGREYGSGGRLVAKRVAEMLDIQFYDKELITLASQETGLSPEFVKKAEERRNTGFIFDLSYQMQPLPLGDQVFIAQSNIIKEIAGKGPCVFVGRCSNYVLRDAPGCLHVFIHAPMDQRIARARDFYKIEGSDDEVRSTICRLDKQRASYYNYFAMSEWGEMHNYDLTVSTALGIDDAALAIIAAAKGSEGA